MAASSCCKILPSDQGSPPIHRPSGDNSKISSQHNASPKTHLRLFDTVELPKQNDAHLACVTSQHLLEYALVSQSPAETNPLKYAKIGLAGASSSCTSWRNF